MSSAERAAFLEAVLPAHISAEQALHEGDATARRSTWSHDDRVTLFGAGVAYRSGWSEVRAVFDRLATTFTSCADYRLELLAAGASADLAYTVGIERYRASTSAGQAVQNTLRATHVYRRESGGWRIVHRHGDHLPLAPSDVARP
jgi:ketosteroid isomerase-like protein